MRFAFPQPSDYGENIPHFLKQMELCIHHARKSFEEMTKGYSEEEKSEFYVMFRFPKINLYDREADSEGNVKIHVDEENDQMQSIELEIFN